MVAEDITDKAINFAMIGVHEKAALEYDQCDWGEILKDALAFSAKEIIDEFGTYRPIKRFQIFRLFRIAKFFVEMTLRIIKCYK